jgi:hypothetical protein
MPLPLIAIPVLHSCGAWIASTAASGYVAGTLSSTWIGAFVLGNSTLLGSLGLVSGAGVFGACGGVAALSSSAALGIGSQLTAVGLGGVASFLGIAPIATFLGLTPIGWAIAVTAVTITLSLGGLFYRKTLGQINIEREKGGLERITFSQIVKEVKQLEEQSLKTILERLDAEKSNVSLFNDRNEVKIDGQFFSIQRLRYLINKDESEEIVFVKRTGQKKRVLRVK